MTTVEGSPPAGPPAGRRGYSWDPVIVVDFDETSDHPGLVVRFTSCTIEEWFAMVNDSNEITEDEDGVLATLEFRTFAEHLVGWNLLYPQGHPNAGEPVPATLTGLVSLPGPLARPIIREWIDRTGRVTVPLGGSSTSPGTSALQELLTLQGEDSSVEDQPDGSIPD